MWQSVSDRIEYGRKVRERAACLVDAHGRRAATKALSAAQVEGIADAERCFWEAVAARASRLTSDPHWEPLFA